MIMKAAVLKGAQQIRVEEKTIPEIGAGEALIKIERAGICGTDLHAYKDGLLFEAGTVMGHEPVGTVEKVGEGVREIAEGDRVALFSVASCGTCDPCKAGLDLFCANAFEWTMGHSPSFDGAFAEYVKIPFAEEMLIKLPDHLSFEDAAIAEPIGTGLRAIRLSKFKPGDSVAVLGAGPIGLMLIQLLKISGARKIICSEVSPYRSEMAKKMGADIVLNPIEEENLPEKMAALTGGLGPDVVFECSGVPSAFRQAFQIVRPAGQIMVVGVIEQDTPIAPIDIILKEINLQGSLGCTKEEMEMVIDLLAEKRFDTNQLVSDTISLTDIEEKGFKRLLSSSEIIKILVKP